MESCRTCCGSWRAWRPRNDHFRARPSDLAPRPLTGRTCLVANPAAGRGRGARLLPGLREALVARGVTDVRLTAAAGDERRLAREAAQEGMETIIALGGDGTWGNAARGILETGRDTRLALLVAGTGNDFSHALRLPVRDQRRMLDIATGTLSARVDVGAVNGTPFLNVAGFGIETRVLASLRSFPLLRGPLLYVSAAIPKLFSYQAMTVGVDGEGAARYIAIVAANGPRFGGGFRVAPGASLSDGLLNAVLVRDAPVLRRASLLVRVRLGRHFDQPEVQPRAVRRMELSFDAPPLMDLDGELVSLGTASVELACLPLALNVAVGAPPV